VIKGDRPGVLFQWQDGTSLSKTRFVEAVCQALTAANPPAKDYASHNFRIGEATIAAMHDWSGGFNYPNFRKARE